MTRVQRKLLIRIAELGLLLTLLVVVTDGFGGLDLLERAIYDQRAKRCQFFSPPPTDKIVHVDLDDQSLHEIGRWPWHRATIAQLIDEMNAAGAKVIALDILFSEPESKELRLKSNGDIEEIDHDQVLADAMRRANNVLVPMSISVQSADAVSELHARLVQLLEADLERTPLELETALREKGDHRESLRGEIREEYVAASTEAMFNRIERELSAGTVSLEQMTARLLPRAQASDIRSDQRLLLTQTYPSVESLLRLQRFGQPIASNLPNLLVGRPTEITIASLVDAARYFGFVDFLTTKDGKVRSVPLCAISRGQFVPHMVLAVACAELGVDPSTVRFTHDTVTIPVDPPIVIPVRSVRSDQYGQASMFMDLPWFGTDDYFTMYDYPAHTDAKQHVSMSSVWRIIAYGRDLKRNEEKLNEALAGVLSFIQSHASAEKAKSGALSDVERNRLIAEALDDDGAKFTYDGLAAMSPAEFAKAEDVEQKLFASYRALLEIPTRNIYLREQQAQKRAALREQLNGRALMVGWIATGKTDAYPTSIHASCPGVAAMGVAVNGILTRHLWRALPWWISAVTTLLMGGLITLIVARLSPVSALLASVALLGAYGVVNGLLLFDYGDLILPAAGTLTAMALCWSGLTLSRFIIESRERARITRRFSNYVDPALVDYVIENPEMAQLDGMVREMTVVFTDLAGFTTISEKLREKTVPILNEYMSLMVPIIRGNGGHWDKFLGDGIMFFYNGLAPLPDHAVRALDSAMEMQIVTDRFNARLKQDGLPNVAMRAGVSSGAMVVGDAGSRDRKHRANNFTVLGDAVNLGARLEGANKPIGTKILCNERTAELSEGKFLLRPVGNVRVVGKLEGVKLFEPLCRKETASDEQKRIVDFATQIVDSFSAGHFEQCLRAARKMEEELGTAKFSQFYLRIAQEHLDNPPDDFVGQLILSEK
ncbi:hypothetical protein BH09PLA1_BH09PLA1_27610 [soil metagenome]